jgi:sugar O-acyltransferase (sialic acid O-acetyltransferase NeuD family)
MVILGAGGHAQEVLQILTEQFNLSEIAVFDNVTSLEEIPGVFNAFKLLRSEQELGHWFKNKNADFVIGVGGLKAKKILLELALRVGGFPYTLIAKNASVGTFNNHLSNAVSIMQLVFVSNSVHIGKNVLINTRASVHHDVIIGENCEIGPHAQLLGKVIVGNNTFIGAGAIILPNIKIGDNCEIGAGAIVTKNVEDNQLVKGNPAK